MIELNPNHLATVKANLAERFPEFKVWAFGSRVAWTAKVYSDLNLVVVAEEPLDWKRLGELREAFDKSDLPMRVKVLDWHSISETFRKVIERNYVVVQAGTLEVAANTEQRETTLGDIADIVMGQSPPGDTVSTEQGLPLLNGPTEFGAYHPTPVQYTTDARKLAQPGDLLFCVRGSTTGRMNWADQEYAIGRGVAAIRHRHDSLLQPFVRGVVEAELPGLLTQATGSTFPNVSTGQLAEIPYPSLDKTEQRAIAHVLGTLDDKIELNRRMNETLEEMARAHFKSWFVDFDPVRAKMGGRWRRGESLPGLPADLYDLFPNRLVPSELGEIPEAWKVKMLGDLTQKPQYGYTDSAKDEPKGPKFLRITDINKKAWIEWESVPYCDISEEDFEKYRLRKNDILIARMADPGHGCMIEVNRNAVFASYLIRFRPLQERHARFLQYWLRSEGYWLLVRERGAGTTRVSLNARVLGSFPLVVPTDPLLDKFGDQISILRSRVVTSGKESLALAAQRNTLLPRMLSGETLVERE